MGTNSDPDIENIVRVYIQLYLLQSFLERVVCFSTLSEVAKNIVQRYGGLSAVLHRSVDRFPQPTKGSWSQWLFKSQARPRHGRE